MFNLERVWSPSSHHLEQNNVGTLGRLNTGRAKEFSTLIRLASPELSPVSCLAICNGRSEATGVRWVFSPLLFPFPSLLPLPLFPFPLPLLSTFIRPFIKPCLRPEISNFFLLFFSFACLSYSHLSWLGESFSSVRFKNKEWVLSNSLASALLNYVRAGFASDQQLCLEHWLPNSIVSWDFSGIVFKRL